MLSKIQCVFPVACPAIILLLCFSPTSQGRSLDLTLQAEARGGEVIRAVQSKLETANIFNEQQTSVERQVYELFVREAAYVESMDGVEFPLGIRDGGLWRVSRDIFEQTQQYNFTAVYDGICTNFCIDWMGVQYSDLRNPLHSGIAINLYLRHLYVTNRRLMDTATDMDKAVFWVTSFGESRLVAQWLSRIDQLRTVEVCRVNTDVMFVLDSSGSIRPHNYQLVRDYAYNFTETLLNGDTDSRVGVILYSTSANVEIDLDFLRVNGSQQALLDGIRNLTYISRATNTPEGLCLLKTRPWRRSLSVLRIAIVLTDGRSNRESTTCMQSNGQLGTLTNITREIHMFRPLVTVFAVGVANYVREELEAIASSPQLVDTLDSFDYRLLLQNQQSRSYFICFKEQQLVSAEVEDNGVLSRGSTTRLKFTGPRADGVTVRICIDQGVVVVYGSYTVPNPSPALHDFSTILRAAGGEVGASGCLVSHATINDVVRSNTRDCSQCRNTSRGRRRKRQTAEDEEDAEVAIFFTIEGSSDIQSQFSVESRFGDAFECAADYCGENGVLNRDDGNCFCSCMSGYERSEEECLNINECAVTPGLCGENGVCTDTIGNYTCGCLEGYEMDGQLCTAIGSEGFQVVPYVIVIGVCTLAALMLVSAGVIMSKILRQKREPKMDQ